MTGRKDIWIIHTIAIVLSRLVRPACGELNCFLKSKEIESEYQQVSLLNSNVIF
jgi:hypothetical protein